jgi:hypothetical protein
MVNTGQTAIQEFIFPSFEMGLWKMGWEARMGLE